MSARQPRSNHRRSHRPGPAGRQPNATLVKPHQPRSVLRAGQPNPRNLQSVCRPRRKLHPAGVHHDPGSNGPGRDQHHHRNGAAGGQQVPRGQGGPVQRTRRTEPPRVRPLDGIVGKVRHEGRSAAHDQQHAQVRHQGQWRAGVQNQTLQADDRAGGLCARWPQAVSGQRRGRGEAGGAAAAVRVAAERSDLPVGGRGAVRAGGKVGRKVPRLPDLGGDLRQNQQPSPARRVHRAVQGAGLFAVRNQLAHAPEQAGRHLPAIQGQSGRVGAIPVGSPVAGVDSTRVQRGAGPGGGSAARVSPEREGTAEPEAGHAFAVQVVRAGRGG
uniref:(northern house mosquito) hypothetical protein n=1 Tax=Culex pipiens TaxID=7175 RepID=A0A8D8DHM6_CULPI